MSHSGQVRRLKRLGEEALRAYPLDVARLVPLRHEDNTTFRVETARGGRYVLRISRPRKQTVERIESEMIWLVALRREAGVQVPEPVHTKEGRLHTVVALSGVPEARVCVLFKWVEGRFLDNGLTPAHMQQVGALTATLHRHSAGFTPPPGFVRGAVVRLGYGLEEKPDPLGDDTTSYATGLAAALCPPEAARTVEATIRKARPAYIELARGQETFGLVHGDLHQNNYLFQGGEAGAIDFDDCGFGPFAVDLAVTLSELRHRLDYPGLRKALLAGYREVRPFSSRHETLLESLIAIRELALVLWRLEMREHPAFHNWPENVDRAIDRLRTFLDAPEA